MGLHCNVRNLPDRRYLQSLPCYLALPDNMARSRHENDCQDNELAKESDHFANAPRLDYLARADSYQLCVSMSLSDFQNTVFALASEAHIQDALFPDFAAKGDELVLEFEEWRNKVNVASFTQSQLAAIKQLDEYILSHSGEAFAELYLDTQQLYSNEYWAKVIQLAQQVIEAFEWAYQMPTPPNAIYIGKNT